MLTVATFTSLIERSHQLEIYYSWDEESPEECSVIHSEIRKALVEAEEKLHFKPDILTKEDVFICSCNGPHPRHFCAYNQRIQKAMCEKSKKPLYLSKQQQRWILPPSPGIYLAECVTSHQLIKCAFKLCCGYTCCVHCWLVEYHNHAFISTIRLLFQACVLSLCV